MTKCDMGRGSKISIFWVKYFLNGPRHAMIIRLQEFMTFIFPIKAIVSDYYEQETENHACIMYRAYYIYSVE